MHLLVLSVPFHSPLVRLCDFCIATSLSPFLRPHTARDMFIIVIVCLLLAYFTGSVTPVYGVSSLLLLNVTAQKLWLSQVTNRYIYDQLHM